ncbi:GIY-YIG nuclease family protein [Candidatus Wolfebacteria bacterium]|nr:GIY-YIG nuclease family protein [Candidatus Wolfebacteria bacterium]
MFFYVYVLQCKDGERYVGYASNLRKRLEEHKRGKSYWTKTRGPLRLIYFEGCLNEDDARQRERYLKSTIGRRFLTNRLKRYYRQTFAF